MNSKELTFEQQVVELMKEHDGFSTVLEYYNCPVELASKTMVSGFIDKLINDEYFKQKLKENK